MLPSNAEAVEQTHAWANAASGRGADERGDGTVPPAVLEALHLKQPEATGQDTIIFEKNAAPADVPKTLDEVFDDVRQ